MQRHNREVIPLTLLNHGGRRALSSSVPGALTLSLISLFFFLALLSASREGLIKQRSIANRPERENGSLTCSARLGIAVTLRLMDG